MVELSVVSAIAGRLGRSRSKRLSSSDEKCWASPAEPPLPQLRILRSLSSALTISWLPCSMLGPSTSMARVLVSMLSVNSCLMRCCISIKEGSLASKSFPDPAIGGGIRRVADGGDNIKATGLVGEVGVCQQVEVRRGDQAFLLAPVDCLRRVAPQVSSPVAYFDEYYCIGIPHDQIKLALFAPVIARHQAHPGVEQQLLGLALGDPAGNLTAGLATAHHSDEPAAGCSCPSIISPQDRIRRTRPS